MAETASAMLSEHEGAPKDSIKGDDVYEPTPEEKKAIKLVDKLLLKAKKHRSRYDHKWLDYYRMFRGRQWKEQRPSYRHSEVINLVFRTIQSLVPIQCDARPRFEFLPQEPADREIGEILNTVAEADWIGKGWSEQLLEVIYDANIYGTGVSMVLGAPNKIDYESGDPVYTYPDPEARDFNKRCTYTVYAEPRDIHWIKRQHQDKAKFIKSDIEHVLKNEKTEEDIKFRSPADRNMVMEGTTPADPANKDLALYKILYLTPEACSDEYDEEEKEKRDDAGEIILGDDGQPTMEWVQTARYPKGRKIITCNGVLLEDDAEGLYDDLEIPMQRYPNYVLSREFWGISEVEQLEGPQRIFNKMVSFALDVLVLMGNPVWMIPSTSGVDPDTLVNRPGLNVEYDPDPTGAIPQRQEGVQLQPFVLQLIDRMGEWFDSIAGAQDITRGVQPTGVTAASAINTLQEAAHTRIRQKARNMDVYLQRVGTHYKSRVFQFYSAPKIVRLTGNEGAANYFRMHIETSEDGRRTMSVVPYTENGLEDPSQARQFEIQGDFDVRVVTGSSLPFAKAEKEQKLLALFDRGVIDAEEVLKGSEYPNYQAVLERVRAQAEAQAQAQAMAPAGPPAA